MRLFITSAVLLTIVSLVFGEPCPEVAKGVKKYVAQKEKVNWFKALLNCGSQGMSLATIESKEEQDMIQEVIKSTCPSETCHTEWWIGGSDLQKNGEFVWFSTNQPMKYQNFRAGEPSQQTDWMGKTEDCLQLVHMGDGQYQWNDLDCEHKSTFICEYFE